MCGIFAYVGSGDASKIVYQGLLDLQYRGYDSWGIVAYVDGHFQLKKNVGSLSKTPPPLPISSLALGHTRWATHGGVTQANAHPHLSCDHRFAVAHNGIIENFVSLKNQLQSHHRFLSTTDTEFLAHYLEEQIKLLPLPLVLANLTQQLVGNNAFVIIDSVNSEIWAYRSGSPLVLGRANSSFYISSDLPTLSSHVEFIYPLSDGELVSLSNTATLSWVQSPQVPRSSSKIKTRYHMESEIKETISLLSRSHYFPSSVLLQINKRLHYSDRIILTGCGSAYHASLFGEFILNQQGLSAVAVVASSAYSTLPTINSRSTIIALSQSGETIDTLNFVQQAKTRGAYLVAVTNVRYSTLDRLADLSLPLGAGIEVAVASTKAFICMLIFYLSLVGPTPSNLSQSLSLLYSPPQSLQIKKIAHSLTSLAHLFVIAPSSLQVVALEAALKFKEIGYLHAEAIVSGELKHGPLALIGRATTCLILNLQGDNSLNSTIAEIEARRGKVIKLNFPDLGAASVLYATNYIHRLSYEHAILLGHNPDQPRNLAKSVTVK